VTRPGGAALYAAVTAHRLGLSAGLVTSHGADFPLDLVPPQIEIVSVPAAGTTVFEHRRGPRGRLLRVRSAARPIGAADLPADWAEPGIVLLAPVLAEIDPLLAAIFTDSTVGAAAQGWLRGWSREGDVAPVAWEPPAAAIARLQALFLGAEDLGAGSDEAVEWFQRVPIGVITAGALGALLFVNGERYEVRPRPATEVDAIGAGDVFAAAFLVDYHRHGDPWEAAAAATCAASLSVGGPGWSAIPDRAALDAALAPYRAARDDTVAPG
jgi:sugar/nucleoside kinase (ribokinase family)